MFTLRPYQTQAVQAVLHYFRHHQTPALIVLPTGAGKSLVIAKLAKLARGRVLVLAHVKELVEQNYQKYQSYQSHTSDFAPAGIYAAGLKRKDEQHKVIFASVQSVSRNLAAFSTPFSLLIIDECHRVPDDNDTSYRKVIEALQAVNPQLKILGLTATPYRLGLGWIYQYHTKGQVRSEKPRFFRDCIFELPIRYLLDEGFLTPATLIDAPIAHYDFSQLTPTRTGGYLSQQLDNAIAQTPRATPLIIKQIITYSAQRQGVMIFAATVKHGREILTLLPAQHSAFITGATPSGERDAIIDAFKGKKIKYLVNVSVLTTGFDAPHVDLIAILRPTESISLYQQIIGRGLRLSPDKTDCLVLDYAGNAYDLYQPEIGEPKPDSQSDIVTIPCPACGFNNNFWGKTDSNGMVIEHFGRRCQGYFVEEETGEREHCGYRFRAKFCPECGADNDIAAKDCQQCDFQLVDPDKKLREALKLKDVRILQCTDMRFQASKNKANQPQLKVTYLDQDNNELHAVWPLATKAHKQAFLARFVNPHLADRHRPFTDTAPSKIVQLTHRFRLPDIVIARKQGRFWQIKDTLFDLKLTEQALKQNTLGLD